MQNSVLVNSNTTIPMVKSFTTLHDAFNEYTKMVLGMSGTNNFSVSYCNNMNIYRGDCVYTVDFTTNMIKCQNVLYCNYLDPKVFDLKGVPMTAIMNMLKFDGTSMAPTLKVKPLTSLSQPALVVPKPVEYAKNNTDSLKENTLNLLKECADLLPINGPNKPFIDKLSKKPIESYLPKVKTDNDTNSTVDDDNLSTGLSNADTESILPSELGSNASVCSDVSDVDESTLKGMKEMIKLLEQEKENAMKELKKEGKKHEKEEDNAVNYNTELNDLKREIYKEKEKEKERINIFNAGKTSYRRISSDLEEGKIDDVPLMFQDKYYIYKFMDERDILDEENDYETYITIFNKMYTQKKDKYADLKKGYVPHNINYLNEEQRKKYSEKAMIGDDEITEFIKNRKHIPSLEEILNATVDASDTDDSSVVSDVSSVKTADLSDNEESENKDKQKNEPVKSV